MLDLQLRILKRSLESLRELDRKLLMDSRDHYGHLWRSWAVFRIPNWWLRALNYSPSSPKVDDWIFFVNPIWWLLWTFAVFWHWSWSRPYRCLGPAVPALVLGVAFSMIGSYAGTGERSWRQTLYRDWLDSSLSSATDCRLAEVSAKRLLQLRPNDQRLTLQLAEVETLSGSVESARRRVNDLYRRTRNPSAAIFLARDQALDRPIRTWSAAEHTSYQSLLSAAAMSEIPEVSREGSLMLADYLETTSAESAADPMLRTLADEAPQYALAAALRVASTDLEASARYAASAENFLSGRLKEHPDHLETRLDLARAMQLQGLDSYDRAMAILADGYRLTRDRRLEIAQSELAVAWSDQLGQQPQTEELLAERFLLVEFSAERTPNDPKTIAALSNLLIEGRDVVDPHVRHVRQQLLDKAEPRIRAFVRGTLAWHAGDADTAVALLEGVVQQGLELPCALNNLALAILDSQSPQLQKALDLIERSDRIQAGVPMTLHIRGRILMRLGRFEEAIEAFEFAIRDARLRAGGLQFLAEAHRNIGNRRLADEYQRRLETLYGPADIR